MATIYDTELKKYGDGTWYRWLGEDEKGTKQNFRLGKDKQEAKRRWRLITALYETQVEAAKAFSGTWVPELLKSAKQIAKGKPAKLPRIRIPVTDDDFMLESGETYAKRLAILNWTNDEFEPADKSDLESAVCGPEVLRS